MHIKMLLDSHCKVKPRTYMHLALEAMLHMGFYPKCDSVSPSPASLSEVWSCCVWNMLQSQVSSPLSVVQAIESVYQLL